MTIQEQIKFRDIQIQLHNSKNRVKELTEESKDLKEEIKYLKDDCVKKVEKLESNINKVFNELSVANCEVVDLTNKKKEQEKQIVKLTKEIEKFKIAITDFKLNSIKDSSNSGKPSSTDGFKKIIQNNRIKTDKKIGGQKGRKGVTIIPVKNPDKIINVYGDKKCVCGGDIIYSKTKYLEKQLLDLLVEIRAISYRYHIGKCKDCKKEYMAKIPKELNNPVQYSNNIKSLVTLTKNCASISNYTVRNLFRIFTNNALNLSIGMIHNNDINISRKSDKVIQNITEELVNSKISYADETGVKIGSKRGYCISFSNGDAVLYDMFKNKSKESFDEFGIFLRYVNILMHDHNITYYKYLAIKHAECNVHILRYLQAIIDLFKRKGAEEFRNFLKDIYEEKIDAIANGETCFNSEKLLEIQANYLKIIAEWKVEFEQEISGMTKLSKAHNEEKCLFERLEKYLEQHLLFVNDFEVPFSNNEAERNLRSIKIKMNVSKRFGNVECAKVYARIKSIIETAKKKKEDIREIMENILNDNSDNIFKMQKQN